MRGYSTLWTVIVLCIVLHYMHIWHLRIRASSFQFRASKINMALARMDKLVKKLMSNSADDGLIPEKSKTEVYLGSMESKHTTRFTRKKACKKNKPLCLHFDRFWHWKPCYYCIYWTLFSAHNSIAYVIFILTQRLVPVYQDCICYLIISIHINVVAHSLIKINLFSLTFTHVMQNQILSIFSLIER